jgi:ech hydrogenase subunit F
MSIMNMGKLLIGTALKKPSTRPYPEEKREFQERTRGHISIRSEDCILCGICSKKCPSNAITVSKQDRKWIIQRMSCVHCGYCVESCPKSCLSMENEYIQPNSDKVIDTVDIPEKQKDME